MKDNNKTPDIDLSNEKSGNKSNKGDFQDLHREMVAQREKWWSEIDQGELETEKVPIGKTNFVRSAHDTQNFFFVKKRGGIRDVYMTYVAQTLWMEVNGALKWKLLNFDQKQLEMLLSAKYLVENRPAFSIQAHPNGDTVSLYSFSSAIPESPLFILDFLISTKAYWFYQGSAETCMKNALYALSRWFLHNLWHESMAISAKDWTVKQMLGLNFSQDPKYKKFGKRYWSPQGCWSAAGLMHWCLRSMNIPSELIETDGHAGLSIRISQSEVLVVDALDDLFAWGDAWDPLIDPAPLFWTHAEYLKMYRGRPATQAFFASQLIRATAIPAAWFIHTLWDRDPKRAKVAWDSYSSVRQVGKLGYPATELNRLFKITHKKVQDIINGKVNHPWVTEIKNRRLDRTKLSNLLIAYRANRGKKPW